MVRRVSEDTVVVIGLGRFGAELSRTLTGLGRDVLAIERDPNLVAEMAPEVTLAVEGDGTSLATLRSLGVEDVTTAVVAIGTSLEASLLATSALAELGVTNIWSKATTKDHQRILEKVGATHVIFPELDMGIRVAHLLTRQGVEEYLEVSAGYAMLVLEAPDWMTNRTLQQSALFGNWKVTAVGVQRKDSSDFEAVSSKTPIHPGDRIVVAGRKADVERFMIGRH